MTNTLPTNSLRGAAHQGSPFNAIRLERADGTGFWSARDLQPLLGYVEWRKFNDAIERARAACDNAGTDSRDHFVPAAKMAGIGSGAEREVLDYHLTRYACYLVAMNGDPRKTEIAQAQTYFAVRTHEAEQRAAAPALPTDPVELLALSLQGLQQHRQQLAVIERRLDTAPIRMDSRLRASVHAACQAFGRVHPKGYGGAYRAFKEAFGFQGVPLAAYDDLPQHRHSEALEWLDVQARTYSAQRPLLEQAGD